MKDLLVITAFIAIAGAGTLVLVRNIRDCEARAGVYLMRDAVCVRAERIDLR